MIYIISDDTYFLLGLSELLNSKMTGNMILNAASDGVLEQKIKQDDVLFICMESDYKASKMLKIASVMNLKTILVIDMHSINMFSDAWRNDILSKKAPVELFNKIAVTNGVTNKFSMPALSKKELNVICELSKGITAEKLSSDMCLSVKSISANKLKALKKMGLNPRNPRSLIIYREIFQNAYS